MKLIIDIDDETYKNVTFYGTYLCPRDKENLEKALKNARLFEGLPEEKWIPCSEQLPEEGEAVLTQAKFRDDIKMTVSARVDFNYWTGWGTREINIVAWMPLPEPYRGDDND